MPDYSKWTRNIQTQSDPKVDAEGYLQEEDKRSPRATLVRMKVYIRRTMPTYAQRSYVETVLSLLKVAGEPVPTTEQLTETMVMVRWLNTGELPEEGEQDEASEA